MIVVTGATGCWATSSCASCGARGRAAARAGAPLRRPQRARRPRRRDRDGRRARSGVPASGRSPAPISSFTWPGSCLSSGAGSPGWHETNVEGTRNVLAACREAGVARLVYCSSIHAFAVPHGGACLTEESPIDPGRASGAYDRSKAEATLSGARGHRAGTRRGHGLSHRRHRPVRFPPLPHRRTDPRLRAGPAESVRRRGIQLRRRAGCGAGHDRGRRERAEPERATSSPATT